MLYDDNKIYSDDKERIKEILRQIEDERDTTLRNDNDAVIKTDKQDKTKIKPTSKKSAMNIEKMDQEATEEDHKENQMLEAERKDQPIPEAKESQDNAQTQPQDKENLSKGSTEHSLSPKPSVELPDTIDTEKTVTKNQKPAFTLIAPKDMPDAMKAEVTLDGIEYAEVHLVDQKGQFIVQMPLEDGGHELLVRFSNAKGEFEEISEKFTVDTSSGRIVDSMDSDVKVKEETSKGSNTENTEGKKPDISPSLYHQHDPDLYEDITYEA